MSTKLIITAALVASVLSSGCSTVPSAMIIAAGQQDRAAHSTVESPNLTKSVTVNKYQFFPNAAEMNVVCADALTEKYGAIDRTQMKITHSRNVLLGISSCTASI